MRKTVAIVGGGAAALLLAAELDPKKFDVCIYERNAAPGRKLLVAGDGGFNLTHSEKPDTFISRYTPSSFFEPIIKNFNNSDLRNWLKSIGIDTFEGSSKRVFPVKGIKPIDVLTAILSIIKQKKVSIKTRTTWQGWRNNQLLFTDDKNKNEFVIKPDITVFALGGGSWKVTGSDGSWTKHFIDQGVEVKPFQSSNCAFEIEWDKEFLKQAEGKTLKNLTLHCGENKKEGEVVITAFGLEGGAVYALSGAIRKQLSEEGHAALFMDLKPSISLTTIESKLRNRGNRSISECLKNDLNISGVPLLLLKSVIDKAQFTDPVVLSERIKNLQLTIKSAGPLDEAISTVGGIALEEIDENFQLKKIPNCYAIGEMLDWDAPTGGYLLQGCFSMGVGLGRKLNTSI
ncbi:MAG: TIGR03862 family flavoprotein [Bacteroidia bacterium]